MIGLDATDHPMRGANRLTFVNDHSYGYSL
jgi:hypothetical protein